MPFPILLFVPPAIAILTAVLGIKGAKDETKAAIDKYKTTKQ